MVYIFHGDNVADSRSRFNQFLDKNANADILRLDQKQIDLNNINNFLNGASFFSDQKILALTNPFSIAKPIFAKLIDIILKTNTTVCLWQDKTLSAAQLKTFPKPQVSLSKLDNVLFQCLNQIKPHNLNQFILSLDLALKQDMYDLLLYLIKNNLRKQLTSFSRFDAASLKTAYLHLIELDFQNKTGQLSVPKEIALQRIMINLLR